MTIKRCMVKKVTQVTMEMNVMTMKTNIQIMIRAWGFGGLVG